MPEQLILKHCSPTLAGLKTGNIFTVRITEEIDLIAEIRELNVMFREKGLRAVLLKKTDSYALIYIYRPEYLKRDLKAPKAVFILEKKGYEYSNPEKCLSQLVYHLRTDEDFPHEIGLFLGYTPSDVEQFMKSSSEGVKSCGCWKAYSNEETAENTFRKYKKCTEVYCRLNKKGMPLSRLTVCTARRTAK